MMHPDVSSGQRKSEPANLISSTNKWRGIRVLQALRREKAVHKTAHDKDVAIP
jgi:hypothetical protein